VNFIDVYFREGRYPRPCLSSMGRKLPALLSKSVPAVTTFKPGERVAYVGRLGSYASWPQFRLRSW
jgi:NADPH2:quinone reductase